MTEATLQKNVETLAGWLGYLTYHALPSQRRDGRWVTSMSGNRGFPDLVLCGGPGSQVLYRELRAGRGKLTEGQIMWLERLTAAGANAGVWTDADWESGRIKRELEQQQGLFEIPETLPTGNTTNHRRKQR